VSWCHDLERLRATVGSIPEGGYMMGHNAVSGFHYEGKEVERKGHMEISEFSHLGHVWMGHIHKRQSKENVSFIGSPNQVRKIEYGNEEVGLTVVKFGKVGFKEAFVPNSLSPKYKRINVFKLMNMRLSEANAFVKNSYLTMVVPSNLAYKLDVAKVGDVLSGYKSIEEPKFLEARERDDVDFEVSGDSVESVEVDIPKQGDAYIDQMKAVVIDKQHVVIGDGLKVKLKETFEKLYKAAEQNAKAYDGEEQLFADK